MKKSQKINHFEAKWEEISTVLHNMKGALCTIHQIENDLRKVKKKLGDGIDEIYTAINEMLNKEDTNVRENR